jgi:hypothetical protein
VPRSAAGDLVNGSDPLPATDGPLAYLHWDDLLQAGSRSGHRVIDTDMAAILYTSGSTGKPKGVVLSHRNMVAGAKSVASYLENSADDTLLAALPLSFDAGFSQLTTAFHAGARVVLLNYLLPQDVLKALARERVTGLTAVPPLYIQLSQLDWPAAISEHLRYFANTGGRMPRDTLAALRAPFAEEQALSDVRPDRSLPLDLPAAGRGGPTPRFDRQGHPQRRNSRPARRRLALCRPTNPANSSIVAPWSAWATGTTTKKPPNATNRCRPTRRAAAPAWCCPRSRCFPATRCAAMRKVSSTSSVAATK